MKTLSLKSVRLYSGLFVTVLMLSVGIKSNAQTTQTTIDSWSFDATPASSGTAIADIGGGALTLSSGLSYFSSSGNGSTNSFGATNWAAGSYYQMLVDLTGASNLSISFDMTGSNTGPESFVLQYATSASSTFVTVPNSSFDLTNITWTTSTTKTTSTKVFTLPSDLANQANVRIRIVVAAGSTGINGSAISTGGTNRIDNVTIYSTTPLPIKFTAFSLSSKEGQNELKWTTGYESAIENFIVESSKDGLQFATAAKVLPVNAISGSTYSYSDASAADKKFYRIKSVDRSGEINVTNVLAVNGGTGSGKLLECNSSIINNTLQFQCKGNFETMDYAIVSNSGAVVNHQNNMKIAIGENKIDVSALSAGLYFVTCNYGGTIYTFKVVK
jgi:hypothetical protein